MSNLRFGPEWYQDQTRPEAIQAAAEMELSHSLLNFARPQRSRTQEELVTLRHLSATHFRLAAGHFLMGIRGLIFLAKRKTMAAPLY